MFECIFVGDTGSGDNDQIKVAKSMEKLIHKNPIKTVGSVPTITQTVSMA